MKVIFLIVFLAGLLFVSAQKKQKEVRDYLPTENMDVKKDANKPFNAPDRKNISLLYVKDANKILYGNPCAITETHQMGFEYIVEPKNGFESKTRKGKFLNNLGVKTKLVITRSPFWKLILKNRIKKCRQQTGDFVG
ncbi:MAG: hypothetical protein GDA51_09620 [Ekhidna sp.]|nr:hypothetical protein [Ekhidna sp.]MBC6409636.1 hypothetical protein [Ekhidna sp.]MBC6426705.1 hypothetical protein [Ekhidna sp.]